MIKLYRVRAAILRYFIMQLRDINRFFEITLWPIQDMLMMGFITLWIQRDGGEFSHAALIPLIGVFFWQVMIRAYAEIAVNLLEELWNKNVANLFSSPISFTEWVVALLLFGIMRVMAAFVVCSIFLWLLSGYNILNFGWWLVPVIFLLLLAGWGLGCLAASLVIRWGQRMTAFVWMQWILAPFCGVFNPIEVLPQGIQYISYAIPLTYTFKAIQRYVTTGAMPVEILAKSFILSSIYFIIGLSIFYYMFTRAKKVGLARIEVE